VFENRPLRRVFRPGWGGDVRGEFRKFHNEELYNLYLYPNIISQVTSTRMRWEGHVARMGEEKLAYKVLWDSPR
jgi:hypothetical protein